MTAQLMTGDIVVRRAALAALLMLAFAGSAAATPRQAATTVSAVASGPGYAWNGRAVTVTVGGTVTWRNRSDAPHTLVCTTPNWGAFCSRTKNPDVPTTHTFTRPGLYSYYCGVHGPAMRGTITVVLAGASSSAPVAPTRSTAAADPATSASDPPLATKKSHVDVVAGIAVAGVLVAVGLGIAVSVRRRRNYDGG